MGKKGTMKLLLASLAVSFALGAAASFQESAGWHVAVPPAPPPFDEASVPVVALHPLPVEGANVAPHLLSAPAPRDFPLRRTLPIYPSVRIRELARGLDHDGFKCYRFVRDHIAFQPSPGFLRGSERTLLDRMGSDADQALLLHDLLDACGIPSEIVYAPPTFDPSNNAAAFSLPLHANGGAFAYNALSWLGVAQRPGMTTADAYAEVYGRLAGSGRAVQPFRNSCIDGEPYYIATDHFWVMATIDGVNRFLDPSVKPTRIQPPRDVLADAGCSTATLLARAGGQVDAVSASSLSKTALEACLDGGAAALCGAWTNSGRAASAFVGGRETVPMEDGEGWFHGDCSMLPVCLSVVDDAFVDAFRARVTLSFGGTVRVFFLDELGPRRLWMSFESVSGSRIRPVLRLNGDVLDIGSSVERGASLALDVSVDLTNACTSAEYAMTCDPANVYCIVAGFDAAGRGMRAAVSEELAAARQTGMSDASPAMLSHALHLAGHEWLDQNARFRRLAECLEQKPIQVFYCVGVSGQEGAPFIDFANQAGLSFESGTEAWMLFASALEHVVPGQLNGAAAPSVSTVRLLQLANTAGDFVCCADADTWASVAPRLTGYSEIQMTLFGALAMNGWTLFIPQRGSMSLGDWTGLGYVARRMLGTKSVTQMLISGGRHGGYCVHDGVPSSAGYSTATMDARLEDGSHPASVGADPVALPAGAFLDERTDVSVPGGRPLVWTRRYDSRARFDLGALGRGWSHGFEASVAETADPDAVFGGASPAAVAPTALAFAVVRDLMTGLDSLPAGQRARRCLASALVLGWWERLHTGACASVRLGARSLRFQRRADGAYEPPPGVAATLTRASSGAFTLEERNGNRYAFDAAGRLASVTDPSANVTSLAYFGSRLVSVRNAFGAFLSLSWSSDRIVSVSDGLGVVVSYGYDAAGNLVSATDASGAVWRAAYDPATHLLVSKTDPDGAVTVSNLYNACAQVTNQTVGASGPWTLGYAADVSAWESDPLGHRREESYDAAGRVLERTNRDGGAESFLYDGCGRLLASRDARGCVVTNVWDARGNLVFTDVRQLARPRSFAYDAADRLVEATDPLGGATRLVYDSCGRVVRRTLPDGTAETCEWTSAGLPARRRTLSAAGDVLREIRCEYAAATGLPLRRRTFGPGLPAAGVGESFAYDAARRLASAEDANGHRRAWLYLPTGAVATNFSADGSFTRFTYTAAGRPRKAWDATGRRLWRRDWTPSGRLAAETFADGSCATNLYDAADRLVQTVDACGGTVSLGYDAAGRVVSRETAAGAETAAYSTGGLLTRATDAAGVMERYWYDWHGNRTMVSNAVGAVSRAGYDATGHRLVSEDPLGRRTRFRYDALGRRTAVVRPSGAVDACAHDGLGRVVACTNAAGGVHVRAYDALGRMTAATNALGEEVFSAVYDGVGNLLSRRDGNGAETAFAYDACDRLLRRTSPDGSDAFAYDTVGDLVSASNGVARETFAYDVRDRLTNAVTRVGAHVFATDWARDAGGLVTNIVYPGGLSVARDYDADGRLVAVRDSLGHVWTFAWDGASKPVGGTSPDGVANAFAYDAAGRLSGWSAGALAGRVIARDAAGRRVRDTVTAGPMPRSAGMRRAQNVFDAADRLVSATVAYGATNAPVFETYLYDGNGALTNASWHADGDADGGTLLACAYDAQGRLASLDADGVCACAYDACGNRVRVGDRLWIPDHADPLKRPLVECDADGTPLRRYIWGDGRLLGFIDADGVLTVAHSDEQGSVIALTTPAGDILFRASYGPHGEDWGAAGVNPTPFAWLGGHGVMRLSFLFPSPLLPPPPVFRLSPFTFHHSLHLTRHRLYSATLHRFLSADPLGIDGGLNLYAYADGNPLAYIDPLGLCADSSFVGDFFSSFGTAEHWSDAAEFYKGYFWDAPVGAVKGAYNLVAHPVETGAAIGDFVGSAIGDPGGTWDAVGDSFAEALSTPRVAGEVVGNALIMAGTAAAPFASAGKVGKGTTLYRIWGGEAKYDGHSWTTVDPSKVANVRRGLGLPDSNTGRFISIGELRNSNGIFCRRALPLDGNPGGLPEVCVPNPNEQILIRTVQGVTPEF